VIAYDDDLSLVAAYQAGSSWSEDNRFYESGAVSWQMLWQPGGRDWAPGEYAGGTWRIGVSERPADSEFAESLSDEQLSE
jgi:hypothetical protein